MNDDANQFADMDDMAEFAVEHAAELAALDRRTAEKPEPTNSQTCERAAA